MKGLLCALFAVGLQLGTPLVSPASAQPRRVNAPFFSSNVLLPETAIFWFGRVDASQNYADVRVGYNSQELWIRVSVFDQWLWRDAAPSRAPASLESWDAVSILLDTAGESANTLSGTSRRFVGQLTPTPASTWPDYQAAYTGAGGAWSYSAGALFSTQAVARAGVNVNDNGPDRGWYITFHIPFSTLGVAGLPATGALWKLGVQLHDRDSAAGPATSDKFWPEGYLRDQPPTWGQLAFGLRSNDTPPAPPDAQTYTIRHGLGGAVVTDAMVGGGATCAEGLDYFNQWGTYNHAHSTTLVVQNQGDVADWPCFSKFYVDFPLNALPAGKTVVSATLTLSHFGGSDPSQALASLVQVFTVGEAWNESTIAWNTAPLAVENVAQSRVAVVGPPWPDTARTWNVSWAVTQAYAGGQPVLRLAVYDADGAQHSGKHFRSSDSDDWNGTVRPTLDVVLADSSSSTPAPPTNLRIVSE